MATLKVYVIHDESLKFREANLNKTLKTLRIACDTVGLKFRSIMITKPNTETLQGSIADLNSKVKYEKIGDPDFDNRMIMLSIEHISNIHKHKEAWTRISQDEDPDAIHLVLEDDAFVMDDFTQNMLEFLQSLPEALSSSRRQWDLCFLGNTQRMQAGADRLQYTSTREVAKILPSKESYIVSPGIIRRLINSLDTMRYILRIHFSWFLHTNQDVRSVFPTKPVVLDGSKIGVCCSTLHPMNPLVLNREFMEMWQLQNSPGATVEQVRAMFKRLEHLKSPDALHLFGRLLAERGLYHDAEDAFAEAIKTTRAQHGLLNPASQLLNDAIANYRHLQKDVQECKKRPSKYAEPEADLKK